MHSPADAKRILEAALLTAPEPLAVGDLKRLFEEELGPEVLKKLLAELKEEWSGRAVELVQLASGWRFQSRPEMAAYLARLSPERPPRYSRAVLETLAIIAYRQPITLPEVQEIRGVNSSSVLKTLFEKKLITTAGKKAVVGTPFLYRTTPDFLVRFGLNELEELPKPEEIEEDLAATLPDETAAALPPRGPREETDGGPVDDDDDDEDPDEDDEIVSEIAEVAEPEFEDDDEFEEEDEFDEDDEDDDLDDEDDDDDDDDEEAEKKPKKKK